MSNPGTQTRRQKLVEKEQSIIAATRSVFRQHGSENIKISEIARLAGLAEGTLYLYFKNKNALLLAVASDFYEDLTRDAAEGIKGFSDTSDRLRFLARHHLERVADEWPLIAKAMSPYLASNDYRDTDGYQLNRKYVEVFDGVVRESVNRGEIRPELSVNVIRDIFYGGLEYAARTLRLRKGKPDLDTAVDEFMLVFLSGIYVAQPSAPGVPASVDMDAVVSRLEKIAARLEQKDG